MPTACAESERWNRGSSPTDENSERYRCMTGPPRNTNPRRAFAWRGLLLRARSDVNPSAGQAPESALSSLRVAGFSSRVPGGRPPTESCRHPLRGTDLTRGTLRCAPCCCPEVPQTSKFRSQNHSLPLLPSRRILARPTTQEGGAFRCRSTGALATQGTCAPGTSSRECVHSLSGPLTVPLDLASQVLPCLSRTKPLLQFGPLALPRLVRDCHPTG